MNRIGTFLKEMKHEKATTRKMLERVPNDKFDWKPHPKSMSIRQLAGHIAELFGWAAMTLTTDGLDFASGAYKPPVVNSTDDLLQLMEKSFNASEAQLVAENEDKLDGTWTLRTGETIHSTSTREEVVRMSLNQIVHHRAQLGVYLRLLDIPIPGSYGPSADEGF